MAAEPIRVVIDRDLEDLIPGFLERRRAEIGQLHALLAAADFARIRTIGHSLKGTGGGYGFDEISAIGERLETAAIRGDRAAAGVEVDRLAAYLECIEIVFR